MIKVLEAQDGFVRLKQIFKSDLVSEGDMKISQIPLSFLLFLGISFLPLVLLSFLRTMLMLQPPKVVNVTAWRSRCTSPLPSWTQSYAAQLFHSPVSMDSEEDHNNADETTNSMVTASYFTVSMGHMQHKSGREEHGAASASILLQQIWHHSR